MRFNNYGVFGLPAHEINGVCYGNGANIFLNNSGNNNHVNRAYSNNSGSSSGGIDGTSICCLPSSTTPASVVNQQAQQPYSSLISSPSSSLSSYNGLYSIINKPNHLTNGHTNHNDKRQQQLNHHCATGTTSIGATATSKAMYAHAEVVSELLTQPLVSDGVDIAWLKHSQLRRVATGLD